MMKSDLGLLSRDSSISAVPTNSVVMPLENANAAYNSDLTMFFTGLREPELQNPEVPTNVDTLGLPTTESRAALIKHYLHSVLPTQFPFADRSIKDFMSTTIQSSQAARDAACLLSIVHMHYTRRSPVNFNAVNSIYRQLHTNLFTGRRTYTEADAIAGLHVVTSFRFSGGRGEWEVWLDVARQFALNVLDDPNVSGPKEALRRCRESTRFIIKTTIWLEVLASITTQEVPRFLEHLRVLFDSAAPEISMLPVVGCEDQIVLAIAEISNLAQNRLRQGTLLVPDFVRRGVLIEKLFERGLDEPETLAHPMSGRSWTGSRNQDEIDAIERRLRNNILRASAKVYLRTVLPENLLGLGPGIAGALTEMIEVLQDVLKQPLNGSVLGSAAFGVCLSGCHTDDPAQRAFLLHVLEMQQEEPVSSIREVSRLLQQVWQRRDHDAELGRSTPGNWRAIMREGHNDAILLV
uniref:Sec14 protein n=1 Tax=Ganoderma boninense TaxID=34458 RepID=A0A5K1K618_9APHY|nr:Putative Sec14 protein [Ganoderma boninense]